MALTFNPFAKKKKEEIQGSGYGSQYASNPSNYSTSSIYANSLSQGKGLPSITGQTLSTPSFSQNQQATQNVVNQANQKIQGSGYTSNYASNPSNQPKITAPTVQQTQKSSVPSYITGYESLADRQKALLEQQRKQGQDYYTKSYAEKNRLLEESIPALQQQFIKTQGNIQKGIDSATQSAEFKKQNAEDEWGESQRLAAQTRAESAARNRNKFAALGTADSWGAGSYGQAQENVESDFNRFTQQGLRTKEQNMFEIDKALQDYEIEAQTTLDGLEASLENTIRQIRSDMTMNSIEKKNALDSLFSDYQAKVLQVEEGMQGVYKEYYQALQSAEANSLDFDENGQPLNQASYEWMLKNPDQYKSAFTSTNGQSANKVRGIIEELAGANTSGVTGLLRLGLSDASRSAAGLIKQLSSELQIEEAKRLKGQGSMSDAERSILANSISAMNPDKNGMPTVSDTRFKEILNNLYQQFGGTSSVKPSLSSFES